MERQGGREITLKLIRNFLKKQVDKHIFLSSEYKDHSIQLRLFKGYECAEHYPGNVEPSSCCWGLFLAIDQKIPEEGIVIGTHRQALTC